MKKDYIPRSFNMATYPLRYQYAAKVITRAVELFDIVRVCYNNYDKIPDYIDDLRKKYKGKVEIVAVIPEEDLKDTGKRYWSGEHRREYYFFGDDDLLPTQTYVDRHVEELEKYGGKIVVSSHGNVYIQGGYDLHHRDYHSPCRWGHPFDLWGHACGAGVMCIDLRYITLRLQDVAFHGVGDIICAKEFKDKKFPILIRKHSSCELEYILPDDFEHTLWHNRTFYLPPVRKIIRELSMEAPLVGVPVREDEGD